MCCHLLSFFAYSSCGNIQSRCRQKSIQRTFYRRHPFRYPHLQERAEWWMTEVSADVYPSHTAVGGDTKLSVFLLHLFFLSIFLSLSQKKSPKETNSSRSPAVTTTNPSPSIKVTAIVWFTTTRWLRGSWVERLVLFSRIGPVWTRPAEKSHKSKTLTFRLIADSFNLPQKFLTFKYKIDFLFLYAEKRKWNLFHVHLRANRSQLFPLRG